MPKKKIVVFQRNIGIGLDQENEKGVQQLWEDYSSFCQICFRQFGAADGD